MKKIKLIFFIAITLILASIIYFTFKKSNSVIKNPIEIKSETPVKEQYIYISTISIDFLRMLNIDSKGLIIEETLDDGANYKRYIASYYSERNKIYGLLTVPDEKIPDGGFPAIVFNHGYIPPSQYQTTQGYASYIDYLASSGFVVFKIDFRGNGNSQGDPSGSYFSSAYTIDAISALKSLQKMEYVNPKRIGMWGHSMAGNLLLRAMLVSDEIKAGVIWSGAVYSYEDFAKYKISDNSYVHRPFETKEGQEQQNRETSSDIQKIRSDPDSIDWNSQFWNSVSLTKNIKYLNFPVQIHHALDDTTVDINYSKDLVEVLKENKKQYEYYEYQGGGHNITSPYFETAMERTVRFFKDNL